MRSFMKALSLPQNGTPLMPKEQRASRRAVSICSMKALSLPQNGTPLTAKEQPASRWAVSICSMKALFGIAAALMAGFSQAGMAFQEGVHYQRLPVPVDTAEAGRVEVVEVFSYACVHCYTFEPYIQAWRPKLDDGVAFRQVPAVFNAQWEEFARLFYAAEQLGILEQVHGAIFEALHERGQNLLDRSTATRFFADTADVEGPDFEAALTSFSVEGQVQRAVAAGKAYGITGTPSLVVNGKFRIDTRMAGGNHQTMLEVANFLIEAERASASEEAQQ